MANKIGARFRVMEVGVGGHLTLLRDWFDNEILDIGLDMFAQAPVGFFISGLAFGSGTTPVSRTDTQLADKKGILPFSISDVGDSRVSIQPHWLEEGIAYYRYSGQVKIAPDPNVISEIGFFRWGMENEQMNPNAISNIYTFNRALVTGSGGVPAPIAANTPILIEFELKIRKQGDTVKNLSYKDSTGAVISSHVLQLKTSYDPAKFGDGASRVVALAIRATLFFASGTSVNITDKTQMNKPYVPGSFQRKIAIGYQNTTNASMSITKMVISTSFGEYEVTPDTPIVIEAFKLFEAIYVLDWQRDNT